MNLGIYIKNLMDVDQVSLVADFVNANVKNNGIKDISIFYDNIGKIDKPINCGLFNSTDLWNFSGDLIVTSLDAVFTSMSIVNGINVYYYGWNDKPDIFKLVYATQRKNIKIICRSEQDEKQLYRLTKTKPIGVDPNFTNILDIINRCGYERCKNCKNVCRAE